MDVIYSSEALKGKAYGVAEGVTKGVDEGV